MKLQQISPTIQDWVSTPPTRDKSFIADIDLADHCPEFWGKCYDVLSNVKYTYPQKSFVKGVMDFYDDWSYITWKQYDSVMGLFIHTKITRSYVREENRKYVSKRTNTLYSSGQLIFLGGGRGLGGLF